MTKKVLVTGANGQLGKSIFKCSSDYKNLEFTFVTRDDLDLSHLATIDSYFQNKVFDIVINCAAYTAVDKAESEPDLANKINYHAVKKIGQICKDKNIILIQISTDYVFNGRNYKPYLETDETDPQNVYGDTKLKGENVLQEINPKGMIFRASWLYSEYGNNFVSTILRLGKEKGEVNVISDQIGTPTCASDLAEAILNVISASNFEAKSMMSNIYHYSNEGSASWCDFAKAIFEISGLECKVNPIKTVDYKAAAKRPYYSILNKDKARKEYGMKFSYWRDSLALCIRKIH